MPDPKELFKRWYIQPLLILEKMPNGDGGFVALAISCLLYERYARALLHKESVKANDMTISRILAKDFAISENTAYLFWDIMRNGLLHQAMPKQAGQTKKILAKWEFDEGFKIPIKIIKEQGKSKLQVQPWLFME